MKRLCFDLDGVICTTKNSDYKKSKPKKKIIELINKLYFSNYLKKIGILNFIESNLHYHAGNLLKN